MPFIVQSIASIKCGVLCVCVICSMVCSQLYEEFLVQKACHMMKQLEQEKWCVMMCLLSLYQIYEVCWVFQWRDDEDVHLIKFIECGKCGVVASLDFVVC